LFYSLSLFYILYIPPIKVSFFINIDFAGTIKSYNSL
jgi:hypothetical protein